MLIKNGNVIIFENDDVKVKKLDIRINGDTIEEIEEKLDEKLGEKVINATDKVVMPGLINTHAHIAMSIFRGTFEGCDLYTWLSEKIWPIEARLTEEQVYDATRLSILEMISTGTTCVNDHYFFSKQIRKALEESKMRAVVTRVLMDNDGKEASENRINEFVNLYESRDRNNDLITYTVSPHGLYTCSGEVLAKSSELALKYNLPIHVHFLESINEIESIKELHGDTGANVLKKYFDGLHIILAHGVKISDEDIKVLKTLDCGIAHCPISNLRLGCKIADTTKYLDEGLNVALGTDGQGSGNNLDMFEAMKIAGLIQGGIHENEKRIIEVGKKADIIIVDISDKLDNVKMLPNVDIVSNLVYNADGKNVDTTIVNGQVLMENRNVKVIDTNKVVKKIKIKSK